MLYPLFHDFEMTLESGSSIWQGISPWQRRLFRSDSTDKSIRLSTPPTCVSTNTQKPFSYCLRETRSQTSSSKKFRENRARSLSLTRYHIGILSVSISSSAHMPQSVRNISWQMDPVWTITPRIKSLTANVFTHNRSLLWVCANQQKHLPHVRGISPSDNDFRMSHRGLNHTSIKSLTRRGLNHFILSTSENTP